MWIMGDHSQANNQTEVECDLQDNKTKAVNSLNCMADALTSEAGSGAECVGDESELPGSYPSYPSQYLNKNRTSKLEEIITERNVSRSGGRTSRLTRSISY